MDVRQAYNCWSDQYDTNKNRTRDLEAVALKDTLASMAFARCLEIGCGTGKNTAWLLTKANHVTAVDFSEGMLQKARKKIASDKVQFHQADITQNWSFSGQQYDLVTFSLVLEHIEDLEAIFQKAAMATARGGYVYVGELHPFKQYVGTKARFDTAEGQQDVTCFTHHVSDFMQAAMRNGFKVEAVKEYFDGDDRAKPPRILALLFKKN